MRAARLIVVLGFALFGTETAALAGELKLSTVRVDLSDKLPNIAMTITNVGQTPALVQFQTVIWKQTPTGETMTPTRDIIANPPIADIPPNGLQLLRIGYVGKRQQTIEGTYRLIVEEVPKKDREKSNQAIETYLRMLVPVFVAPLANEPPKVAASMGTSADGKPAVTLKNNGNIHVRLLEYHFVGNGTAKSNSHKGLYYVLPGSTNTLPLADTDPRPGDIKQIEMTTDSGNLTLPLQGGP